MEKVNCGGKVGAKFCYVVVSFRVNVKLKKACHIDKQIGKGKGNHGIIREREREEAIKYL